MEQIMSSAQTTFDHTCPQTGGLNPRDPLRCHFADPGTRGRAELDALVILVNIDRTFIAEPAQPLTWPGSLTLFSKLARSTWRTDPLRVTKNQRLEMPIPHFSIHLEVRVLLWKPSLSVLAFYETYPHFSQQQLIARLDAESLKLYYDRRRASLDEFARHCHVASFKLQRFPEQIGKAEFPFSDATVADGCTWLRPIILGVSDAIDQSLSVLDVRRPIIPIDIRPSAA